MGADPEAFAAGYREGAELFDRGDYFTAHEVWEQVWRYGPVEHRRFFQSLIQAAAALYHWERGNITGAVSLCGRGRDKVAGLPTPYLGLDLPAFWDAVAGAISGSGGSPRVCPPDSQL